MFLAVKIRTAQHVHRTFSGLMSVRCIAWLGITDRHDALIVIPVFVTQAPTCFGTYVPSSGSVLYPYELLERQKWLWCSHVL
jgi:hypothetical protein